MTLTASDKRVLTGVSRMHWPRNTLLLLAVIAVVGLFALGFCATEIAQIDRIGRKAGGQRNETDLRKLELDAMVFLLIASTSLMSAICLWHLRRYGLLIRKLGDKNDA